MNQLSGTFEQMKPHQPPISENHRECVFCGSSHATDAISNLVALDTETENQEVCVVCLESMQDRQPMVWLRWLKRYNPEHWQKVVDNHRLRSSTLSNVIRRMRIE